MLYFENDYCEGAHPAILQKLTETNFEKVSGYGTDPYCASAKEKIRAACACPEADVFFISGGTQANSIVIASTLRRWEGVVAAATGHVAGHEAGAIEFTGHKVIGLPQKNGKLDAATVEDFCKTFYADSNHDHMVFPGMVYISHPTEYGTLYSKAELEALSAVCHTYHMPLFVDGARLGYALVSEGTDTAHRTSGTWAMSSSASRAGILLWIKRKTVPIIPAIISRTLKSTARAASANVKSYTPSFPSSRNAPAPPRATQGRYCCTASIKI